MMSLPKQNDASKTNRAESAITAKRKASEELLKDSSIRREVKTYGKRVKPNASLPSTKRQRISQAFEESKNAESQTKIKPSQHLAPSNCPSIKSYFQPVAACSNPKSRKRPRRLTTKNTQPLPSQASFEMGPCLSKIFGPKTGSTTTTSGGNSSNAAKTHIAPVHSGAIKRRQMLLYTPVDVAYCCVCTMRYDRTDDNDVAEHAKFHKTHCSIEKLEKPLKTAVDVPLRTIWKHPRGADEWIISIDRYCSHSLKGFACSVLDLTLDDIGSPFAFTPESVFHNERTHKVYVYVKEGKPVAVLDAEQDVPFAGYYQVDKSTSRASNEKALPHKVYMLVDRIWTKKEHRRKGYATKLIDAARDGDFWGKWRLDRESIAFSWPTEVGRSFAAKYQKDCFPGNGEFLVDLQFF